jgi:serine phosphatase RsbU (regulator of sigma subunit)
MWVEVTMASANRAPQSAPLSPPLPGGGQRAASPASAEELALRLAVLERERRDFGQQLFEAGQVQRRLSGPRQFTRGAFQVASEVFPVWHVGGDFVCAMDLGAHSWIALGDIGGKGLAAAMWFTHLVSLIRCHAAAHGEAAKVMRAVNEHMCALQPSPPLTSMLLFVLDPERGELECCNAGHPAPLVLRCGGALERLEAGGPLLGVLGGASYDAARLRLHPGDVLLGCTDGVLECRNSAGDEFGPERLVRAAREHAGESAQAMLFSLLGETQDFAAGTPRHDDISLLLIRHAGAGPQRAPVLRAMGSHFRC